MMFAIIRDGHPEALSGAFIGNNGVQYSAQVLGLWSQQELAAIDVYPVVEPPIPEGKVVVGAVLKWDDGTVTRAWNLQDYVPPVPEKVSRFQARAALMNAGLLAQVEIAIADAPQVVQLAWADAVEFRRTSPTILAMAEALELDGETVDDLFRAAAEIEV